MNQKQDFLNDIEFLKSGLTPNDELFLSIGHEQSQNCQNLFWIFFHHSRDAKMSLDTLDFFDIKTPQTKQIFKSDIKSNVEFNNIRERN